MSTNAFLIGLVYEDVVSRNSERTEISRTLGKKNFTKKCVPNRF